MSLWQTRAVQVEAVRWSGENVVEVVEFSGGTVFPAGEKLMLQAGPQAMGLCTIAVGDWIVREEGGALQVLSPERFVERYEPLGGERSVDTEGRD